MNKNKRHYTKVATPKKLYSGSVAFDVGNTWFKEDLEPTTIKKPVDKWDVDGTYPFKITQQYKEVYTDEYKEKLASMTDTEKAIMKMNLNSMYGLMGGMSQSVNYYSSPGGIGINHPGTSYGIKTMYYMTGNGKGYRTETLPHEGTAICIQKQRLVAHFEHKLKKTSPKKKAEYENLTKIIEMHQGEIDIYMDEFPERFI